MIYGKNGIGKINFVWVIFDIVFYIIDNNCNVLFKNNYLNVNFDIEFVIFEYEFLFENLVIYYFYKKNSDVILIFENLKIDNIEYISLKIGL